MASALLHGLGLVAIARAPATAPDDAALDVELVTPAAAVAPAPRPGPAAPPAPAPAAPAPAAPAPHRRAGTPAPAAAAPAARRATPGGPAGAASPPAAPLAPRAPTPRGLDLGLHGLPPGGAAATATGGAGRGAGSGAGAGAGAGDPVLGRVPDLPSGEPYPLRPDGARGLVYGDQRFTAHVAPDGSVRFDDRHGSFDPTRLAFGFDLNDEIMRLRGHDPYGYEKRKFLAATWERRLRMRERADRDTMRRALRELPDRLEAIWGDAGRSVAERRRLLFLLWEEADTATEGGRQARRTIEGFVRRRLPRGTPAGFTDEELGRLAGRAARPFD